MATSNNPVPARQRPVREELDILVCGLENVGKRVLVNTFCNHDPDGDYDPTGPHYDIDIPRPNMSPPFRQFTFDICYRPSILEDHKLHTMNGRKRWHAIILVYDVSNRESFTVLPQLYEKLKQLSVNADRVALTVIAMKADMRWNVSAEEGMLMAQRLGGEWGACSLMAWQKLKREIFRVGDRAAWCLASGIEMAERKEDLDRENASKPRDWFAQREV
ncbi:hypothetical protein AJ80_08258 [Polytolypa hystricis UAMH7299]|uniref:small monomeric GTPase n=1 Tax=Polytolypa hystricis (strain UAMH7299) TaxID=1447883 RepID=A0A2B7XA14_POLH7|nr:hypothetical protein AJ80_08258 [Polytolypa hystricis UAMH7299]